MKEVFKEMWSGISKGTKMSIAIALVVFILICVLAFMNNHAEIIKTFDDGLTNLLN